MEQEKFTTKDGAIFERDGSRYYKSTGLTDKKGQPIMGRVSEDVYESAKADRVSEPQEAPQKRNTDLPKEELSIPSPKQGKVDGAANIANDTVVAVDMAVVQTTELSHEEWERLQGLFQQKIELEKHAFGSERLKLSRAKGKVILSGLTHGEPEYTNAAHVYLSKLIELAKKQSRVNHTGPALPENERYAFRTWLLRLGFVGREYKDIRAILLQNLPGSSSFRDRKRKGEN